jgi:hypothetical protein
MLTFPLELIRKRSLPAVAIEIVSAPENPIFVSVSPAWIR